MLCLDDFWLIFMFYDQLNRVDSPKIMVGIVKKRFKPINRNKQLYGEDGNKNDALILF